VSLLCSEETMRRCENAKWRALGVVPLKGKTEPINTYTIDSL